MGPGIMAANRPESEGGLCNSKSGEYVTHVYQLMYRFKCHTGFIARGVGQEANTAQGEVWHEKKRYINWFIV